MKRPNLLTHWTGKDIDAQHGADLGSLGRTRYLERLWNILSEGFWMTTPPERLYGRGGVYIDHAVPMTCFTELRGSAAADHSMRFGQLGIAVDRGFVLANDRRRIVYRIARRFAAQRSFAFAWLRSSSLAASATFLCLPKTLSSGATRVRKLR